MRAGFENSANEVNLCRICGQVGGGAKLARTTKMAPNGWLQCWSLASFYLVLCHLTPPITVSTMSDPRDDSGGLVGAKNLCRSTS